MEKIEDSGEDADPFDARLVLEPNSRLEITAAAEATRDRVIDLWELCLTASDIARNVSAVRITFAATTTFLDIAVPVAMRNLLQLLR